MVPLVPVAQYCNPAIGGQGYRDAHGLSAKDPCPRLRLWISIRTMPNDVDDDVVRSRAWGPYMSVWGQYLGTRVAVVFGWGLW